MQLGGSQMGECEICGSGEAEYIVQVEGAKLSVCRDCSGSGKLIRGPPPKQYKPKPGEEGTLSGGKQELEVVEGYGSLIASARKRMGLPLEVLGERINEKWSYLERVEHEKTLPDPKVCHKLEKELGIKLLVPVAIGAAVASKSSSGGMTLGDILDIEMKKKKKE